MFSPRAAILAATVLAIVSPQVQAGLITVQTTRINLDRGFPFLPLDPFSFFTSVAGITGRWSPLSGTYALQPSLSPGFQSVTVPLLQLSDVTTFLTADPDSLRPIFMDSFGNSPLQTLLISIQDSEIGDIGTIEVNDGLGVGISTSRLSSNGPILSGMTLSSVIIGAKNLTADPNSTLTGFQFRREIDGAIYTVDLLGSGSFILNDLALGAPPPPPIQTGGLRVSVTTVPEAASLTSLGIGGMLLAAWALLRRMSLPGVTDEPVI